MTVRRFNSLTLQSVFIATLLRAHQFDGKTDLILEERRFPIPFCILLAWNKTRPGLS
jgi:hypothetical protein